MTTDTVRARLYSKKLLDFATMDTKMLSWMASEFRQLHGDAYALDGVLSATPIPVVASGNNAVNIAAAVAVEAVSGNGRRIKMLAGDSRLQGVKVPPDAAVVYHIGLEQADVEQGIEINPRTGDPEYLEFKEMVGRVAVPTSVTDNGNGTLTINVNSLCESGKDYSGRTVRVWLKSRTDGGIGPKSPTEAIAIQNIAITYSAPNNTILVPNILGQTAASTTAADYKVMMNGPTVKRAGFEDLAATVGCLFLATATSVAAGNPIAVISTSGQNLIALSLSQIGQASNIQYGGGGAWSDGTTNPATTVEAQLDKIISDLSPTTGGAKIGGAASGADIAAANLNTQIANLAVNWGKLARTNTWSAVQTFSGSPVMSVGLTLPVNQHVEVSGTGKYKHGTKTRSIDVRKDKYLAAAVSLTSATVFNTPAVDFAYFPLIVDYGTTITAVRFYLTDSATGPSTLSVSLWEYDPVSGSAGFFGGVQTSNGSGTQQTLTISPAKLTASPGQYLLQVSRGAGTANCTVRGAEFDYTQT